MSFFYDLNKRLDSIRATPEVTHQQLNERDLGKHNNATTGFAALAKKTGGGEKGAKIAGAQLAKMRAKGQVEEGSIVDGVWTADPPKKGQPDVPAPSEPDGGILNKKTPPTPPASAASRAAPPTKKTANEAARWRAPEYKDQLYTQNPPEDDADTSLDTYYDRVKPAGYQGAKRLKGSGSGDPLTRGFGRSGTGSAVEKGPRKGLPKRDQITSLKGSIKDAHGTHTQPNLPEAGVPMTAKQQSFAALAPPANKITFADRIAGAKKEVDEMLGNVAADAMKKAIGGGGGRNAEMDEGHFDDTPTRRRSSSGGEIDTSEPGVTRHRPVKGNYSGAAHSAEEYRAARQADAADRAPGTKAGRRTVGAGQGTKIGAKINRGTSKLMTREGDQDPADQGEYDREGEMGRNEIHTMMRNAKQLEKMLGNNDDLPEWVQKKLSLASDYMQTIADYLASERETDAEDETGRRVEVELAEKKAKPTKQSSGNDGNLANNAKPYDKVTRGDVVAGRLGKDEMGGKKKSTKPSAKKEEEVDESTTAGSVATAPTASKASKGGMSFGKGIYDSIDRAVERQINESMNISMNMSNDEHGGPQQTLTITATDEDASQLATLLKMAGMGGGGDMSHGEDDLADQIRQAEQGHGGCDEIEQMDEGTVDKMIKFMQNRLGTAAEKAASNTASDAYMAANGEANFRKLIDKLESDPAKYKYTGSPKTTRLPYMGPPKDIEDPAASAFKSYYEPGTATPTNRISTIDKPPQMRRSTDRPAFDQSVRQTTVRDPFDPLVDESYGDNVVDMNSPNYPTNTESAQDNFGYSGGVNKPKRDVAGNGQTTVPVTAVRGQNDDFQESIQRMREIAGIKETPSMFFPDPRDTAKQLGIKAQSRLIDTPTPMSTGNNRGYTNTFLDPAQKAQQRLSKQNESIFTDTANLWKSYKG